MKQPTKTAESAGVAATEPRPTGICSTLLHFFDTIKFSHTIFALPFAFTGALLAAAGIPSRHQIFWILLAMVGARTAAMGLNRLIDAEIDRENPRTRNRAIPAGLLGKPAAAVGVSAAGLLFLLAAYQLNPLCFALAPLALALVTGYSYCKRFTALSHLVLGLCLAAAPIGAWIAITGSVALPALVLGSAVLFWVAGFDILYALQDLEFDRTAGLHSIPARLGSRRALIIARLLHLATVVLLLGLYYIVGLGFAYLLAVALAAVMLAYEHWLVRDGDLARLDAAFFTMNGYISLTLFAGTLLDVLID
jgi:4-hydroxybenzoate polyprenyltransferase